MKKNMLIVLLAMIFSLTIVKAANYLYNANNVSYSSSSLFGNNVQDAIDSLANKCESSTTSCPSGMTCTDKTNIKCKRATTLHTETCSQNDLTYYCSGDGYTETGSKGTRTITYGNEMITEGVLSVGDAFDCDVNGDGTYDASNERFYYVSDYYDTEINNYNDSIAVLIYYSNTTSGIPSNNNIQYAIRSDIIAEGTCQYSTDECTKHGPVTVKKELPTTSQWSNVSLYRNIRMLLADDGNARTYSGNLAESDYTGYAARLLTYQEAYHGCYDGSNSFINSCRFLFENSKYSNSNIATNGPWLETPHHTYGARATYADYQILYGKYLDDTRSIDSYYNGARPTIEVLKSEILY